MNSLKRSSYSLVGWCAGYPTSLEADKAAAGQLLDPLAGPAPAGAGAGAGSVQAQRAAAMAAVRVRERQILQRVRSRTAPHRTARNKGLEGTSCCAANRVRLHSIAGHCPRQQTHTHTKAGSGTGKLDNAWHACMQVEYMASSQLAALKRASRGSTSSAARR